MSSFKIEAYEIEFRLQKRKDGEPYNTFDRSRKSLEQAGTEWISRVYLHLTAGFHPHSGSLLTRDAPAAMLGALAASDALTSGVQQCCSKLTVRISSIILNYDGVDLYTYRQAIGAVESGQISRHSPD